MTHRILVVDDHEVVRLGLRTLLSNQADFVVVDEAGSADEALVKALAHRPDVVARAGLRPAARSRASFPMSPSSC